MRLTNMRPALLTLALLAAAAPPGGCAAIGVVADRAIRTEVAARYDGLAGQEAIVMVYADTGTEVDFPTLKLNLGYALQSNLAAAAEAGRDGIEGASFPYRPESVLRWQEEHPDHAWQPLTETAADLPVARLVYVEVEQLATRPPGATGVFLGTATASVSVAEVVGEGADRVATVVFEENDVRVQFPKGAPDTGRPDLGDTITYRGTVQALADEIATRFVTTPGD